MTRELLEARKAEMEAYRAQNAKELQAARERVTLLQATDNTIHGVIQDCEHWLAQISPEGPDAAAESRPALVDVLKERKQKREGAAA